MPLKKYSVLVIDDEAIVITAVKSQLERHFGEEIEVGFALSADEGMLLLKDNADIDIPVVICDYRMPGIKGDQLIMDLYKYYPDTFSILLTGQIDVEGMGNIMNHAKLFRYIAKPWNETDFVQTIREAIQSYKLAMLVKIQNKQINDYAFSNAHKVRGPLARILGLINIIKKKPEIIKSENLMEKLETSATELDTIVRSITQELTDKSDGLAKTEYW